jgi:hypothetical protein
VVHTYNPRLRRLRQEDCQFQVSLVHRRTQSQKTTKRKKEGKKGRKKKKKERKEERKEMKRE